MRAYEISILNKANNVWAHRVLKLKHGKAQYLLELFTAYSIILVDKADFPELMFCLKYDCAPYLLH